MAVISAETKIQAVEQCYAGAGSLNQIAERFGVHRSTLQKWLLNYDLFGEEGLRHRAGNHHYPAIVKQQAVELYLSGQMSIEAVCKKYQLRSRSQLEQWVMLYNGQKGFRSAKNREKGGVEL
jgi:transposase-like protein